MDELKFELWYLDFYILFQVCQVLLCFNIVYDYFGEIIYGEVLDGEIGELLVFVKVILWNILGQIIIIDVSGKFIFMVLCGEYGYDVFYFGYGLVYQFINLLYFKIFLYLEVVVMEELWEEFGYVYGEGVGLGIMFNVSVSYVFVEVYVVFFLFGKLKVVCMRN